MSEYVKRDLIKVIGWVIGVAIVMGCFLAIDSNNNHRQIEKTKIEVLKQL